MLSKLLYCVQQLNANNSSTYKINKFKELYDAGYINKELSVLLWKLWKKTRKKYCYLLNVL